MNPKGSQTFGQYLRRMPLGPLLLTIALAVAVRMSVGTLLLRFEPGLSFATSYLISMIPALAAALLLTRWFWRRSQGMDTGA